jgi:prevent-host-death family protein
MTQISLRIPLAEAKNKLSELIERVSLGEEFIITRHDQEIARLIPASRPSQASVLRAVEALKQTRAGNKATMEEILSWKDEARR